MKFSAITGRVGRILLALVPLVAVACGAATASDPEPFYERNNQQWLEAIEPGGVVRVFNPYGNVYARFGGYEHEVELQATVQRLEPERPGLAVEVARAGSGLEVRVGYPAGSDGSRIDADGPIDTRDRIDLVIFVPEETTFDVETIDGRIEAKGLHSDVNAASKTGEIMLRKLGGRVRVTNERGRVSAMLQTGVTDRPQEIVTVTGEIEVHVWEDANLDVKVATSGEISTDFSMTIEHRRFEEPGKHAAAVVGKGGPKLTLRSKRGRVRLLRLQKNFKPEPQSE